MTSHEIKEHARRGLRWQLDAMEMLDHQIDDTFVSAAQDIAGASKVVTTGLGKSGFIARKMAATLTSVNVPSVYLHPVDALHGDLGVLSDTDVVVAFSKSGETPEVVHLVKLIRDYGVKVVSIVSRANTTLGRHSTHSVVVPIIHELDPHNLLPTASTTQALIMADLLSVAASEINGNIVDRLQRTHPKGSIGAALIRTVDEVMYSGELIPRGEASMMIAEVVALLTSTSLGIVCIMDAEGRLEGVVTDGDVRRLAGASILFESTAVGAVMTRDPIVVAPSDSLHAALQIMENRDRQLSAVPVVVHQRCVGVIRVHDIIRAQM